MSLVGFNDRINWLLALAGDELARALEKFPPINSPHEGKAVIEEELDELWLHVKANTGMSTGAADEAIQIAAMALRYVHDLGQGWGPLIKIDDDLENLEESVQKRRTR